MEADAEIHLDYKHLINEYFRESQQRIEKHKTNLILNIQDTKINKTSARTERKFKYKE